MNGEYWIPTAEAQALGLVSSDSVTLDGYAGFTNVPGLSDYSATNTSGTYRITNTICSARSLTNSPRSWAARCWTAPTLPVRPAIRRSICFHYSAPGDCLIFPVRRLVTFSPTAASTNLGNFNTNPEGDFGDWASSAGNNSYLAFSDPGVLNSVTASDLTVMNFLGWDFTRGGPRGDYSLHLPKGHDLTGGTVSVSAASGVLANVTDIYPMAS